VPTISNPDLEALVRVFRSLPVGSPERKTLESLIGEARARPERVTLDIQIQVSVKGVPSWEYLGIYDEGMGDYQSGSPEEAQKEILEYLGKTSVTEIQEISEKAKSAKGLAMGLSFKGVTVAFTDETAQFTLGTLGGRKAVCIRCADDGYLI
jgi:hypothetical protein